MVSAIGGCVNSWLFADWELEPKETVFIICAVAAVAISLIGIMFTRCIRCFMPEYTPFALKVLSATSTCSSFLVQLLEKTTP